MDEYRIAVTGGRDYRDALLVCEVLDGFWPFKLAHGGARGADAMCAAFARYRDPGSVTVYPADWERWGRRAGPLRNRFMLDDFQPHVLIAFPGGRGTADCVRAAHERNIPVFCPEFRI